MKLVSWNVAGFRAILKKGFEDFFYTCDADVYCLQEVKAEDFQIEFRPKDYYCYVNSADKKGYSGTLIYTLYEPISIKYGIDIDEFDHEGRVITLEFNDYYLVNEYVPNVKRDLSRLDYRMRWEEEFKKYVKELEKKKPVVICGDFNVAHEEIDIKNPDTNHQNAGFSDEERAKFTELLNAGFKDTFRELYPEKVKYSWWSYRFNARKNNAGWRIDYFVVSNNLMDKVEDSLIYDDIYGSDHCPVGLKVAF